jgi:hypothetical protein
MKNFEITLDDIHGNCVGASYVVPALTREEAEKTALTMAGEDHPCNTMGIVTVEELSDCELFHRYGIE